MNTHYLGEAWGWDTQRYSRAIIDKMGPNSKKCGNRCKEAMLIKNSTYRHLANGAKFIGYIPGVNILAAIAIITYYNVLYDTVELSCSPSHRKNWNIRAVAMLVSGPLLLIVDLVAHIYQRAHTAKYEKENPNLLENFKSDHIHSTPFWPGHPVECTEKS